MGKRSNFARNARDFYPTPRPAVYPLQPHIEPGTTFVEPCAGDGALIDHLQCIGLRCRGALDLHPLREDVAKGDALQLRSCAARCFITNPPWTRDVLHQLIVHLSNIAPTWLLMDADWMHTIQAAPLITDRLRKVVSVPRLKWIPDSRDQATDNCCWYLFHRRGEGPPVLYPRIA